VTVTGSATNVVQLTIWHLTKINRPDIGEIALKETPMISEEEKHRHIETAFQIDDLYLRTLECLREDLTGQGIDIDSGEGRKFFIRAVRELNERFYQGK